MNSHNSINGIGVIDLSKPIHEWRILNFGEYLKNKVISSPIFKIEGSPIRSKWRMHIIPLRNNYLYCKLENDKNIEGFVALTFHINVEDAQMDSFQNWFIFRETKLSISGIQLNIVDFISKSEFLENSKKSFKSCTLKIPFSFFNSDYHSLQENYSGVDSENGTPLAHDLHMCVSHYDKIKVFNDYKKLLNNKDFSDVIIAVNEKTLYAHKCILAMKSPVFENMFNNNMIEQKTSTVNINDVKYEILLEMLRFMYAGEVENFKNIVTDLFYAADKYQIEQLKEMCVDGLIDNMSADNVIGYLHLADRHNVIELKDEAVQFIVDNAKDIVDKSEFEELSVQNPLFFEIFKKMASK